MKYVYRSVGILTILLVCVGALQLYVYTFSTDFMQTLDELYDSKNPVADAVLILGAGVSKEGVLSELYKDRVDTAIAIYQKGYAKKILISGDNGTRAYNEVSPVRTYVLDSQVPPQDVFVDYAGFDTYDSLYRARNIFLVENLIVVSQGFHLPRAIYIARYLGLHAHGVAADATHGTFYNKIREVPAVIKAVLNISLRSTPKYLGETIPISGDGRESWGD